MIYQSNISLYFCHVKAKLLKVGKGHAGAVYSLHSDSTEGLFYTGSADRMVGSWNVSDMQPGNFSVNVGSPVFSILKIEDRLYVGQGEGGLHVIDMEAKREIRHLKYHKRPVFQILRHAQRGQLYTLGGDGLLSIIDAEDYSLLWSLPLSEDKLRTALLSSDGKHLLIGGSDGWIRVLETEYFNILSEIKAHEGGVYDLKGLPDGRLISGGRDGHLRYWRYSEASLEQVSAVPAHNFAIYSIDINPRGDLFASGSRDKTVKIWDTEIGKKPLRIERVGPVGHTHSVNVVKWLSDDVLVSAGDDRDLHFWLVTRA